MRVEIIIHAHNEEKRIGNTLEKYSSFFEEKRRKNKVDYEILVVINNTIDNTKKIVSKISSKNKRISYLDLEEGGKGHAVIEGFKRALRKKAELIGFVDADMATSPKEYYNLITSMKNNDAAIANRYLPESKVYPKFTFRRIIVGKVFNFFVRAMFLMPYTDTQCGAKIFSRKAAEIISKNVRTSQWAFDVEMIYLLHKNGMRISEVPTEWYDIEESRLNLTKASIQMFFAILRLRVIKSKMRRLLMQLKPLMGIVWRMTK